jgi:hypothetical protein
MSWLWDAIGWLTISIKIPVPKRFALPRAGRIVAQSPQHTIAPDRPSEGVWHNED